MHFFNSLLACDILGMQGFNGEMSILALNNLTWSTSEVLSHP